jgi:hypothetical protein
MAPTCFPGRPEHVATSRKATVRQIACTCSIAALGTSPSARAEPALDNDPTSVFIVAKNQNKNQVHYGVRLDPACSVVGAQPVYSYWRMLERGGEVEPILPLVDWLRRDCRLDVTHRVAISQERDDCSGF